MLSQLKLSKYQDMHLLSQSFTAYLKTAHDDMTLSIVPCYFLTHDIYISIDVIHVNIDLLSSNHASHTSSSNSPIITRENSIDGLYIAIQESRRVTNYTKSNCSN